jgi:pimeloyl-ACP methyl ester carboxylesterase
VLVPYLRGSGLTRRILSRTPRNGRRAAVARDTIALLDALRIEQAVLAGFDWEAGWA